MPGDVLEVLIKISQKAGVSLEHFSLLLVQIGIRYFGLGQPNLHFLTAYLNILRLHLAEINPGFDDPMRNQDHPRIIP